MPQLGSALSIEAIQAQVSHGSECGRPGAAWQGDPGAFAPGFTSGDTELWGSLVNSLGKGGGSPAFSSWGPAVQAKLGHLGRFEAGTV